MKRKAAKCVCLCSCAVCHLVVAAVPFRLMLIRGEGVTKDYYTIGESLCYSMANM